MKTKVSIDLWGTLIKASPTFKTVKYKLVEKYTGINDRYSIENAFILTKRNIDYVIERTGWQPTQHQLWKMIFNELGINTLNDNWKLEEQRIDYLHWDYCELALEHEPLIFDNYIRRTLDEMSQQYQLVLSSNTLFLPSYVLDQYLIGLGIKNYFTELNFSDKLEVSKPNPQMYGKSKYHIGDNIRTDYHGALMAGSLPYLINSNDKNIVDAYYYIIEKENELNGITKVRGA